jgi:hypothetical protein
VLEQILDKRRLIRKREVTVAAKDATQRLSQLIKEQTARLEAEVAAGFVDRTVVVTRLCGGRSFAVPVRINGVSISYTGFRLVGEFIDPVTELTRETTILIDELEP